MTAVCSLRKGVNNIWREATKTHPHDKGYILYYFFDF